MATKVGIIVLSGTLDKAMPAFIIGTTAAAMGMEVGMFFSFYGLNVIHKEKMKNLKVSPVGNPAMPIPVPQIFTILPGMMDFATAMMKDMMKKHKVPSIEELINQAKELDVKLYPCQMAMSLFGYKEEDLIDGLQKPAGAATFLNFVNAGEKSLILNF
ncbi:DsrE/DsrF/DrsH-like family protein [Venenivibrio stagnispumantis]|uniref:Peroxiredoxin family protein n=1 Tax=Venenivibrio stagnispumantis TaxID=407998 RepID=A0AA45WJD4_9AQUI|nr:DsrE/DsrF/DrsH-like family protein [Venenivibrio stagnispumantis]MCW4572437.1 DsrE/DsrF/DrsH-like family protein [Venenivibrio stagnispumantis]SMP03071.1 Peroxiredoxin family protein [Venenivibrio stagnispumantis]